MRARTERKTDLVSVQAKGTGRDYRLDFFRGLALVFIFIDHIPDNVVSYFTLRSFAFCDAAEVFIFISGYTAALAYAPMFDREGVAMGAARIYRRVWQLYVAHLCLFMIFNAEVGYTLKFLYNPLFADELQVGDYLQNPGEAFIHVLLLQFQPSLLNILPLYIVLLLGLPLVILLARRHALLVLIPSAALWVVANMFGWNMPGYPDGRLWFFDPFAWQFLFGIAVVLGLSRARIIWPRWLPPMALVFAAVTGVATLLITLHEANPGFPFYVALPESWFDKTMLPPARLLSVLSLAVLVSAWFPRDARCFTSRMGWLVVLCGQNSLEVFCLSILLAVFANFVLSLAGYGIAVQIAVNLAGLFVMAGFGLLLSWFKAGGRLPLPPVRQALTILLLVPGLAFAQTAWAACPAPDDFVIPSGTLTATSAAIAQKNLTILALGGASTLGGPAEGRAFTYPSRLEAHLREALPGIAVKVAVLAIPRVTDAAIEMNLDAALAANKPSLVIWGLGAGAAARGDDLDTFVGALSGTFDKIRGTGADGILMTLQYAPSVGRLINLPPYRMAVLQWGDDMGVPVLDRYELMRFWNDTGFLDLDATAPEARVRVARTLYDCMGEILSKAIVDAVK